MTEWASRDDGAGQAGALGQSFNSMVLMRKVLLLLPLLIVLAACGRDDADDRRVVDMADEIEPGTPMFGVYNALKAMGTPVEVGTERSRPFFEEKGRALIIGGADVELYEFDSKEEADEAAAQIAPDGNVKGQPAWSGPVEWFRTDRVIALYEGGDPGVTSAITTAMGPMFAGRR
jgi:hypothetical protein